MTVNASFLNGIDQTYNDFVVRKYLVINELNVTLREIEHLPSGAQIMHIDATDLENLFCLSFKTYPDSSNGAPHILEHTVLCGSQKFPVKDPFFGMTRRSVNTFMNALTGSDFTCYPAASQNEKDFYNLLDVYLDAVFHPQLKTMSFLQEGHRLEFTKPDSSKSPLQIKGIVYNEMKGSLLSADTRLWHALLEELVPDLPYSYNSGGDPKVIPQLTYEELLAFHAKYYHPSHCLFFFYGNFSLKKHLDVLSSTTLQGVQPATPLPLLPRQKRFKKPIEKDLSYPVAPDEETENRAFIAFGFLTTRLIDQQTALALCLLDAILMDNDASILKAELLKSGLCAHVDAYIDLEMSEVPYAIIFKGCDPEKATEIETLLFQAIQTVIDRGIPKDLIDAALHQLEFSRLEIATDHSPFGLTLFMRAALAKQHLCPPENALMLYSLFHSLLHDLADPSYLTNLMRDYLLNNLHRVRLTMRPDPELSSKEIEQEKQTLAQMKEKLSKTEIEQILKQTKELEIFQKQTEEESCDCLPKVDLADVDPKIRTFPLQTSKSDHLTVHHHPCFTNHISYADLFIDLPFINQEDLPYANLLFSLIPELGCGKRNWQENLHFIQSHIGGVQLSCPLYTQVADPHAIRPAIHIRGKVLDKNLNHLCGLMKEMLETPHLHDKNRIAELLKKMRDALISQVNKRAMRYASLLAFSGSSSASFIQESWYGLTQLNFIEALTKDLPTSLPSLIEKLSSLKDRFLTYHNPTLVLSCSEETYEQMAKEAFFGLSLLKPQGKPAPWTTSFPLVKTPSQARIISSQVAFLVKGLETVTYLDKHSAPLTIASSLFENLILHKEIREQGGAYGTGASYSSLSGHFHFHSYRDPHIASSLTSFEKAVDEIAVGNFSESDLEEAKLSLIQHMDAPVPPSVRALTTYTWEREGKTDLMRQHFRSKILDTKIADVQEAVSVCLLGKKSEGTVIAFAGQELLTQEAAKLKKQGISLPSLPLSHK